MAASQSGPEVINTKVTADLSDLDKAAGKYVDLLGIQGAALNGLTIKMVQFNETNGKAKAVLEGQLDAHRKIQLTLKAEGNEWEVTSSSIKKHTLALTEDEKATKRAQKAADDLATANLRAQKGYKQQIATQQAKDNASDLGPKPFLGAGDFVRIAEATLFKSALTSVTGALQEGIQKAKEFQIQISLIRTVSQDAQLSMQGWATGLKDVSNALGIDILDVTKAAYEAVQSQVVSGAQTLSFLRTAGELARTTGVDMAKSQDLLSSTIQAFKLSLTEADHTAAVLFKTVELGRIKVDELSNTLGRVGPTAGLLGIKLEEVGAAYSTLTRQGIKTSDASTLLINVISKMAKPTEAMKKLLNSWGFETGQAAVKTLGFVEVLRRLESTTDGRLGDLSELFNELRGLRGAAGLTSAFGEYEADLKKIDDADKTYKAAIEIRAESSADKLAKFGNAAKNTFIVGFGQDVIDILGNWTKALESGDVVAKRFANGIGIAAAALIGGKLAMIAFTSIQGTLVAAQMAGAATTFANAQALIAYNAALASGMPVQQAAIIQQIAFNKAKAEFVPSAVAANAAGATSLAWMGIATIAVVGLYGAYEAYNKELKATVKEQGNLNRIYEETKRLGSGDGKSMAQKDMEAWEKKVNNTFAAPLKLNSEALKGINAAVDENEEKVKAAADAFGVTYKDAAEQAKKGVTAINTELTKNKARIKESASELRRLKESMDDSIRGTQYKYANDFQKQQLNAQNVKRLYGEMEELYKKGDEESVKAAHEKAKNIEKILSDSFELDVEQQKKQLEEWARANPVLASQYGANLSVSTVPLQNAYKILLDYTTRKEKELVGTLEQQNAKKKEQLRLEEDRQNRLATAVKNYSEFSITKNGKVKDDFLTDGKVDKEKVLSALRKLQTEIIKAAPGDGSATSIDFFTKMMERAQTLVVEGNLQANKSMLVQDQDRLTKMRDMYLEKYREIKGAESKFSAEYFSPEGTLDKMKKDGQSLIDATSFKSSAQWAEKAFQLNGNKRQDRLDVEARQADAVLSNKAYQDAVEMTRKNATRGPGGELIPRKEDLDRVARTFEKLKADAKAIAFILAGRDPNKNLDDFAFMNEGKPVRIGDIGDDFGRQYGSARKGVADVEQGDQRLKNLAKELSVFETDAVGPLLKAFPDLSKAMDNTKWTMENFYGDLQLKNLDAIKQVQTLIESYKELQRLAPKTKLDGKQGRANLEEQGDTPTAFAVNPQGMLGADDAEYFASGGYAHPGKARGSDTIPAWLSPGEFIVNAASTQKFYAQLMDMNRGVSPRYYARGGYVTTNVGDVHVHMESNSQPSASRVARQMGQELRREIRRGNVKLN